MSKSINELVREAHANAVKKGWWDPEPTFAELIWLTMQLGLTGMVER